MDDEPQAEAPKAEEAKPPRRRRAAKPQDEPKDGHETGETPEAPRADAAIQEAQEQAQGITLGADADLHERVSWLQAQVGRLARDGHADVYKDGKLQYSYDYVTESALMAMLRPLLAQAKVAAYTSWREPRMEGSLTTIGLDFTLHYRDQSFTMTCWGTGADRGDKGVYKAMTGCMRYLLWKWLLVPTGDEPDNDHQDARQPDHARAQPNDRQQQANGAQERQGAAQAAPLAERTRMQELLAELDAARTLMVADWERGMSERVFQEALDKVAASRNLARTPWRNLGGPDLVYWIGKLESRLEAFKAELATGKDEASQDAPPPLTPAQVAQQEAVPFGEPDAGASAFQPPRGAFDPDAPHGRDADGAPLDRDGLPIAQGPPPDWDAEHPYGGSPFPEDDVPPGAGGDPAESWR